MLNDALEKLGHAPEARATLAALTPREDSIIDVQILVKRLNTPEDAKDTIAVLPDHGTERPARPSTSRARC